MSGCKSPTNQSGIQSISLPPRLYVPVRQHIGEPARLLVKSGDYVYKGQPIAESNGFISASVHAPSSGQVGDILSHPIPHTSLIKETCVLIETDGKDQWHSSIQVTPKPLQLSSTQIHSRICDAGIVGLGGAVFPSAVKLHPTREIETLIINGVECEPFITCDDVLMQQRAEEVIRGILLLARVIKPIEIILAIEDNKPAAYDSIAEMLIKLKGAGVHALSTINMEKVPTKFPTGGEKQLVKVLTGKEIGSKSLPFEVGVICLNVGTTAAIHDAIYKGQPLISRIVTVTGDSVQRPGNYQVLLGTPIDYVLQHAGVTMDESNNVIMGGPMMGVALATQNAPVVKATNCLLIRNTEPTKQLSHALPCIRCGQCANSCPMNLLPQQLYWHSRAKDFKKLENCYVDDCIECGCCQIVCPSKIPLVQYFRYAKSEIKAQERERKIADISRLRSELRQQRLERKKREDEERRSKRKAARSKRKKNPDAGLVNALPEKSSADSMKDNVQSTLQKKESINRV